MSVFTKFNIWTWIVVFYLEQSWHSMIFVNMEVPKLSLRIDLIRTSADGSELFVLP